MNKWIGWLGLAVSGWATAASGDIYVTTNGSDTERTGKSWEQAYATLSNAVAQAGAGEAVWVSNGVYNITAEIVVDKGIPVTGVGPGVTLVQSSTGKCRIFRIAHADAVLDGFTISKGEAPAPEKRGAGVYLTAGLVLNCVISNNTPTNTIVYGAGAWVSGGTMSNCVIRNNSNTGKDGYGHGVCVSNGLLTHSFILDNNKSPVRGYGGTVYIMTNGVVSDCHIQGNVAGGNAYSYAGGVYVEGGLLKKSSVVGNSNIGSTGSRGGGVYLNRGRMENCLVASNWCSGNVGGGGVTLTGGTIVNCTIVANKAFQNVLANGVEAGAGVQWDGGGTVSNSIVAFNTRLGGQARLNIGGMAGSSNAFSYSCAPELAGTGRGNLASDPRFVNGKIGDYRLMPYSPCVDGGTNTGLILDRDGNLRPQDGIGSGSPAMDMGAYELASATGYFNCYFQAVTNEAFNTLDAVFSASVFGPNTNGLYYTWNFGNGTREGAGLGCVTQQYSVGTYTVTLTASNETGAVTNWTIADCIRVGAPYAYVATNGGHVVPFDTWAKAATSILAAVQAAVVTPDGATRVIVSNGTYQVPSSSSSIFIDRGITVSSLSGAGSTLVWGRMGTDVFPNFDIDHPDAVVEGFTSANAHMGVQIHRGTMRNCVLRHNASPSSYVAAGFGFGARLFGGTLENCIIASNAVGGATQTTGGGVWMTGESLVRNCVIFSNMLSTATYASGGGGVALSDPQWQRSVLRNCLIYDNFGAMATYSATFGSGVYLNGGRVENCTIAGNNNNNTNTAEMGGGLNCATGTVANTIVCGNTRLGNVVDNMAGSMALVAYSCSPKLPDGVRGNITNAPVFRDSARRDYRLGANSPGINAGTNLSWTAEAEDLAGNPRRSGSRVDMGAFERSTPGGLVLLIR